MNDRKTTKRFCFDFVVVDFGSYLDVGHFEYERERYGGKKSHWIANTMSKYVGIHVYEFKGRLPFLDLAENSTFYHIISRFSARRVLLRKPEQANKTKNEFEMKFGERNVATFFWNVTTSECFAEREDEREGESDEWNLRADILMWWPK